MINKRIYLSLAHMSGHEQAFIREAFDDNWVAPLGPNVDTFEKNLNCFLEKDEVYYVVALNTGTAALHLGLILLGVQSGDEVICQSLTFSASCNPICYQGAIPVFVDSEKDTWNMSPVFLEKAILDRIKKGKKPKAIIPVHLYGMPAKMDKILAISRQYEIPVLEDSAESLGSVYKGKYCGTFGEIAALSFNGNKIITTSGGGALVSKNKEFAEKARFLSNQAQEPFPYYYHLQVGYNYRMSNICAGIGCGQMMVLPQRIEQRRKNNRFYRKHLSGIEGICFQTEPSRDFFSNYWLTSIIVDPAKLGKTREDIRLALDTANIESRPLWKPMHLQPVFKDYPFYGDGTSEKLFDHGLCLPSGSNLTEEDLFRITENIQNLIT